jgi:triacylglycerol lipase
MTFHSLTACLCALSLAALWVSTARSGDPVDSPALPGGDDRVRTAQSPTALKVKKIPDLCFCDHGKPDQRSAGQCDVYLPQAKPGGEPDQRWPVILVVHGGGWATGDKWTMDRHARQLAQNGFAAVSINYRLAPESKFPDPVDDVRAALVWIAENAATYSFDPKRVGLYGYSAGGHLVSLVATMADEPWEEVRRTTAWTEDDARWQKMPAVRAVCIGGPPTDFRQLPPDNTSLAYFLGGSRRELPDVYEAASPICFASPKDPPFQFIHGEADGVVSVANSKDFHRALVASQVDASIATLPRRGHFLAFISPQLTEWMLQFFVKQLSLR